MLIPIYRQSEFKVGDIIISLEEIVTPYYIFSKYHEFKIVEKTQISKDYSPDFRIIDNEHGVELKNFNLTNFTLKVDLGTAKKRDTYLNNESNLRKFIIKNCPHIFQDIDDRDYYDACKLKGIYGYIPCNYCSDCIKYIDENLIKQNKEISSYLRSKKIKKIEKASE